MPFLYTVNAESDEPIMLINRHIGFDDEDGEGIRGDLFQQELLTLDGMGKKRIQVWINSVGGNVMEGYAIYNAILKSKTKVDTYCCGMAASICAVIFQAGRNRIMADYGVQMYHNPSGSDNMKLIDAMKGSLVKMISGRSGMNEDDTSRMMNRTTYISAEEALALGLCDTIEKSIDLNKKRLSGALTSVSDYWKEANKIVNKLLTSNSTKMLKVTNKLGLTAEANEDSILAAVDAVMNRATKAESDLSALQNSSKESLDKLANELKNAQDKAKKLQEDYDKMKNDLDAANKEKIEVENKAKQEKAKGLIDAAVKAGKIKNEAKIIAEWTEDAVADFDKIKNRLDSVSVNKTAAKFEVVNREPKENIEMKGGVALAMSQISNRLK
jgi:ATP-dependent protease ClpP protease subunit